MEAVPRLPMLGFKLKQSAEPATSFNNLKLYIAELYQEDANSYSKEVQDLETLRNVACRPSHDMDGCLKLKRYYCQLNSLVHRFPLLTERPLLTFAWRDAYSNAVVAVSDLRWEMAVILYNIAALHSQLGSEEDRTTPESMKLACTHFQCAAGALEMFKEHGAPPEMTDLCSDVILFMNRLCLAYAQECILEKSLCDNRKPGIVAKVTAQILNYYNSALVMIIAGGEDGPLADMIGSKQFKAGKKFLSFKISYLSAILYMYQGQAAEEAKRFGDRVTLCQLAWDKFEEAKKEASKGLADTEQVQKALTAAGEIIEARRKAAKNENEFIYHEEVPDISSISAVQGANLVNGIPFSVTDSELLGTDIFHRLVPMKAHEGSSLYSEEKAQLLRSIGTNIEDRDSELNAFMSSLNMEFLQFDQTAATKLPQAIVDRCASLNARPNAIPDLVALMSQLAENCGEVEMLLREIKQTFAEEEVNEKAYQQAMGQRPTVHLSELNREYQKYQEAHNKAGESNETLRKAMGLHVANLRTLSKPMTEIQALVPQINGTTGNRTTAESNPHFAELRMLLNKVTEMRGQRTEFVNSLREAINSDDITSKIVAWGDNDVQVLFRQEMAKHEKTAKLIDMNLVAQGNILKALTDCYAKCASAIKQMSDTKHKRDQFFSALVASYDVYEDLLGKSTKGLEFYKKLHNNVAKLLTRVKAARDVQSEERQQRLNSTAKTAAVNNYSADKTPSSITSSGPKLRDYMKAGLGGGGGFVPSVRPSPLGSENTATSTCATTTATDKFNNQTMVTVATGATMQYGSTGSDHGAGGVGNNFNPQSNYATNDGSYYNTSAGHGGSSGYGQHHQQQQQQQQGVTTGYVNPIYQTGSYGMQKGTGGVQTQQQQHSYSDYPATMSSSSSVANSSVPTSDGMGRQSQEGAGGGTSYSSTGAYNYSQQYGNTSQPYMPPTSYPPPPAYSASNPMTTSNNSVGYSQQHQPQSYQQERNPSVATGSASNYATTQSNTTTPYSYAMTSANGDVAAAVSQSYGQSQQYAGYSNTAHQNAVGGYNNQQYAAASNNSVPTITSSQANIPQVAQQMSQMNITTPANTTGYGNYYGAQTSAGQQSYYGQQSQGLPTANSVQFSNPQQYGTPSSVAPVATQYSGGSNSVPHAGQNQYDNNSISQGGYGGHTQQSYGGTPSWQSGSAQPQDMYGQVYNATSGGSGADGQGYMMNPMNSSGFSNPAPSATIQTEPVQAPQPVQAIPTPIHPPQPAPTPVPQPATNQPPPVPAANPRDIDLLSGVDFAAPVASLPEPMLQPKPATSVSAGNSVVEEKNKEGPSVKKSVIDDDVVSVLMDDSQPPPSLAKMDHIKSFLMSAQQQQHQPQSPSPSLGLPSMDRKMSMDNISICSEISSIDQNFDWESVSVRNEVAGGGAEQHEAILSKFRADGGADDPKVMKWFHSEVERLEKFLEGVNIKTLNGSTPLDKKWQELQNLLAKDSGKRTTTVAKLFPEKNRSSDCIPFDHARVQLPTATDDYVNACYVKELGSSCLPLILAQTPMQTTNKDFWHMVWAQKSKLIVCLHTPTEMVHPFWPTKLNEEMQFDDFSVTLLKQFDLTNCVEYSLKLMTSGSDVVHELSALQLKTWAQNVPSQVVGVARDVITSYKQRVLTVAGVGGGISGAVSPIVINCLTGSKRSPLVAVAVTAVLATKTKPPLLINLVDAWFRIATQRRGVLENERELEYSFQVILSNAHDLLNKHGIMTPYQVKNAQKAAIIEKEQIKDPLSELDALWKMKK